MAKSLEEVMKKMQLEHEQRQQARQAEEQKAAMIAEQQRRQWAERNRMFEKSTTTSAAASSAAASSAAAGAGAGGNNLSTNFIVFELNTLKLGLVRKDGTVQETNVQPFDGVTALASCSDDPGFLYFITNSDGDVSFGKMNKRTLERIDIASNIGDLSDKSPVSLVYTGEGVFWYVDALLGTDDDSYNDTFTITTEGVAEQIGQLDHSSVYPEAVFKYNNEWYMSATDSYFITGLYLVDIENSLRELVGYFLMDPSSLPAGIGPTTKVWYVLDTFVENGRIYGSVIFTDKDHGAYPYACVGEIFLNELEPENPYIKYLYGLPDPFGETNHTYTSIDIR